MSCSSSADEGDEEGTIDDVDLEEDEEDLMEDVEMLSHHLNSGSGSAFSPPGLWDSTSL